ncbi:hypothetical protein [Asticcacaulis sp. YBE204]|uniref:hypothetical protein n=1 Tax=Asticcacaulis sp. YBE204 TaxID=1282363 RepID=UPI0003C3C257|nr:hypothetical protein [Asticcacaulis sp. YBE204]ESQ80223.1 hypothetical protein AEYBE204_06275 [Asticcacaulis sp. YBE204]
MTLKTLKGKPSYLAISGWIFAGYVAGLCAPFIALYAYFALGLSDWSTVSDDAAKPLAFLISALPLFFLMTAIALHFRKRRYSFFSLLAALAFLSVPAGFYAGWVSAQILMNYGIDFRL